MGLITWIIVIVAILAVIGLGVGTFFTGVWSGAQKVGSNPSVQGAANQAKEFASNATKNVTSTIVGKVTG
jgi:hypothetical protein